MGGKDTRFLCGGLTGGRGLAPPASTTLSCTLSEYMASSMVAVATSRDAEEESPPPSGTVETTCERLKPLRGRAMLVAAASAATVVVAAIAAGIV